MVDRPLRIPALALALAAGSCTAGPVEVPLSGEALAAVMAEPGTGRARLARRVDAFFTDAALGETRALLVIRNGRIVAERYGPGFSRDTRLMGWSMAKTVTAAMIGMLVADGRLRLDSPAPVPAWQRSGDPRGAITLRHLLQMRSGLDHAEEASVPWRSDRERMLLLGGRDDMAALAEAAPLAAIPGREWHYSTATTVILADLAARALSPDDSPAARRRAVRDYLHSRLFGPLQMDSAVPEFDARGTFVGSSFVHATARDWGKFGEFLRLGGAVRGAQLVPRQWIALMTAPSPANPGYGAQTWLNRAPTDGGERQFPGAPASAFSLNGHLGQYVVVSPRHGLTVVRLGHTPDSARAPVRRAIGEMIATFPERTTT